MASPLGEINLTICTVVSPQYQIVQTDITSKRTDVNPMKLLRGRYTDAR